MSTARVPASHAVYEQLWDKITQLKLAPGERLLEAQLLNEFGVSRTPFREAVRRLMAEDLVQQSSNGMFFIRPLDVDHLEQVYRTRSGLEQVIVRQACEHVDEELLRQLESNLRANQQFVEYPDMVLRLGADFHSLLADAAGNDVCRRLLGQLRGHTLRYRALSNEVPGRLDSVFDEHAELINALRARDPDRAAAIMDRHVMAALSSARQGVLTKYPAAQTG